MKITTLYWVDFFLFNETQFENTGRRTTFGPKKHGGTEECKKLHTLYSSRNIY